MRRVRLRIVVAGLAGLHLAVAFAGFLAPYDPAQQNRALAYMPPARIHFFNSAGRPCLPFIYVSTNDRDGTHQDLRKPLRLRLFTRGASYRLFGLFRADVHLFGADAPQVFILGTDSYGRDVLSRLLYGAQISVGAGLLATILTLGAALVIGTISGYYGKWVDEALMGSAELFLCLPWFYFLVGVRAFLPLQLSTLGTFFLIVCIVGLIGWARPARLIRGAALSARNRNYVLAARGFGAPDGYLMRRHVAPETYGIVLTQAALLAPQYIAAEAVLSFCGLGIAEPVPSWGNMLSALQNYNTLVSHYWLLAPAGALVITSVMYWLLADGIHHWLQSHSI
jgi:peptide/nickel transport system permease protein